MLATWKDGVNYSKVAGPPQRDISIFTTQSPGGVPGTHLINLGRMTKDSQAIERWTLGTIWPGFSWSNRIIDLTSSDLYLDLQ